MSYVTNPTRDWYKFNHPTFKMTTCLASSGSPPCRFCYLPSRPDHSLTMHEAHPQDSKKHAGSGLAPTFKSCFEKVPSLVLGFWGRGWSWADNLLQNPPSATLRVDFAILVVSKLYRSTRPTARLANQNAGSGVAPLRLDQPHARRSWTSVIEVHNLKLQNASCPAPFWYKTSDEIRKWLQGMYCFP